jgi:phosphonate transport system substrate-binding protein
VKGDASMAEADKDAKVKEIEAQKASFEALMAEDPQT